MEYPQVGEPRTTEAEYKKRIDDLLRHVGMPGRCSGCQRDIFWVRHRRGAVTPYTAEGVNHFVDCPMRDRFRKDKVDSDVHA